MNAMIEQINLTGKTFVEFSAAMLIQSSILIAIILFVDLLLRNRVRAIFRYCIWMLVLVKLVLPSSISSPFSVGYLLGDKLANVSISEPADNTTPDNVPPTIYIESIEATSASPMATLPMEESEPVMQEAVGPVEITTTPLTWQGAMLLVWVVVAAAMGLLLIQRAMLVCGLVKQAKEANNLMNDALEFCREQMGIRRKIGLKASANATSPAVCGLFRPVILLPQNLGPSLGARDLRAVLMHELAHIKRGDLWVNLAQTILQIIYFYNPLLWLANLIIRRVREQAVDEAVQVAMGQAAQQYPETLVNVAKMAFKRPALGLRLIGVVESKSALKGRIKRMLDRPIPKSAKLGVLGLFVVIITGAVLLPMAATAKNEESMVEDNKQTLSQFIATLPNGATVELIGTCQYTEDSVDCYRPDGTPLGRELKIAKWNQKPKAGDTGIMLKVSGPEDISFSYHKIQGTKGWEGSCHVLDENGQEIQGWEAALTRFDNEQKTTSMTYGVAAGAWKTVAEHDGRRMGINNGISFTQATETEKGVQIYTTDTIGRDVTQRIVAVDNNGKIHPWKGHTGSVSNSQIRQSIGTFPSLKLNKIEKFQFQTRPYEWVTFKNVSLQPGVKTTVDVEGDGNDNASNEIVDLTFRTAEDLNRLIISGGSWSVEDNKLLGTCPGDRNWATYNTCYKRLSSVLIRGMIVPPSSQNLRIWVGPIHLIFNWEMADENHYRNNTQVTTTSPHELKPGQYSNIELRQEGKYVIVIVDEKVVYTTEAVLAGMISVQAAHNSTIAIEMIKIEGEPDPSTQVTPLRQDIPRESRPPIQRGRSQSPSILSTKPSALQGLIDSARSGQTVVVPKGVYNEPIVINKSLTLKGESRADCIFEVTVNQPAIFVDTKGQGRVTVEDLTIKWQPTMRISNILLQSALKTAGAGLKAAAFCRWVISDGHRWQ